MECYLGYPSQKIREVIRKRFTKIYYVNGTSEYKDIVGELTYENIGKKSPYDTNKTVQKVEIGTTVTSVGDSAFRNCNSLISISIPNSVTQIRGGAFNLCTQLSSVTIPNSLKLLSDGLFYQCNSLSSILIPDSITSIAGTFIQCKNLQQISCCATTAPTVQTDTFGNYTSTYTGRNTYSTGTNTLYVPQNATGYDASYWQSVLLNSSKCGFHIEYMS